MIELNGITWNHTRGYVPLVATAQRFEEASGGRVRIRWEKRSLQSFADELVDRLASRFDLLVIDHPFIGSADDHPALLPLDEVLPVEFLADQAENSVGRSYPSYVQGGRLWALPIDAAAPTASWRPDLLEAAGATVPQTWDDVCELAQRGLCAVPAIPVDSLLSFFMLCAAIGEQPLTREDRIVSREVGVDALRRLRTLVSLCGETCLGRNPIATYEAMVGTDDIAYCPFAYCYSNYARDEFTAPRPSLRFGPLVRCAGRRLRSVLGGTGLAISRNCREVATAAAYAQYVASPQCQSGLFFASGGQPGHRSAWVSDALNARCHDFFRDTMSTLDEALLRPRIRDFMRVQDHAGPIVHACLRRETGEGSALDQLDALVRDVTAVT